MAEEIFFTGLGSLIVFFIILDMVLTNKRIRRNKINLYKKVVLQYFLWCEYTKQTPVEGLKLEDIRVHMNIPEKLIYLQSLD